MAKCGDDFQYEDKEALTRIGLGDYYCPQLQNYTIGGSYFSEQFNFVKLEVSKCYEEDYCKSLDEINERMRYGLVQYAYINNFFDVLDYEDPVKPFFDDSYFWDILPDFKKNTDIFFSLSQAELQDDLL